MYLRDEAMLVQYVRGFVEQRLLSKKQIIREAVAPLAGFRAASS